MNQVQVNLPTTEIREQNENKNQIQIKRKCKNVKTLTIVDVVDVSARTF